MYESDRDTHVETHHPNRDIPVYESDRGTHGETHNSKYNKTVTLIAGFTMNPAFVTGEAPLSVTFASTATGAETISWNFGDGTTATGTTVTHTFTELKTYTVTQTVSNAGRSASYSQTITPIHTAARISSSTVSSPTVSSPTVSSPTVSSSNVSYSTDSMVVVSPVSNPTSVGTSGVDFKSNITSGKAPLMVQFEDNSGGNPIAWEWDFNSDGQVDSNKKNPVYEFRDPGTYSVTLRTGNGTSWGNITKINYITIGDGFQASFTALPIEGKSPLTVQFNDTSTGNITSWLWDFGDETSSIEQNPTHTYFSAGTYNINLTVRNADVTTSITTTITLFENCGSGGVSSEGISDSKSDSSSGSNSFSGGSNGAGAFPEPRSNVNISVLTQKFVKAGNRIRFDFIQNATCIDFVVFDAKKTLEKTTTTVEQLKERSILAPVEPGGTIYRYINIWVGNEDFASSENVENATLGFRMSKAEIPVNKTGNSTVFLQRYSKGGWNKLDIQKTGEDDRYIYFQARTPGFSPFAITLGRTKVNESEKVNKNILENSESLPMPSEEANYNSTGLISKKDWQGFSSVIGLFIGLMLLLFIGLAIREKINNIGRKV